MKTLTLLFAIYSLLFYQPMNAQNITFEEENGKIVEGSIQLGERVIDEILSSTTGLQRELLEEILKEKRFKNHKYNTSLRNDIGIGDGAEPFIHQSKYNPNLLGIAYMSPDRWKFSLSQDGGETWGDSGFDSSVLRKEVDSLYQALGGGDPVFFFDANDNIHVAYIYLYAPTPADIVNSATYRLEVFYGYSNDVGNTWQAGPSIVSGLFTTFQFVDRIWMDVNPVDNVGYLAGSSFSTAPDLEHGIVLFSKGLDDSQFDSIETLAVPAITSNLAGQTQHANVLTDDEGNVYVSGVLVSNNSQDVIIARKDAGSNSFQPAITVANTIAFNLAGASTQVHGRENGAISLAVDNNNVYLAWTDMQPGNILAYYAYSNDGGETFSAPVNIGDMYYPDSTHHALMPCIAADDGNVVLTWYAVDKETLVSEYVAAYSDNAGANLQSEVYVISDDVTSFDNANSNAFFGDYNSVTMEGETAHITWADGQEGLPRVYYSQLDFGMIVNIAEIQPLSPSVALINVFPQPAMDHVNVSVTSQKARKIRVEILSADGRIVLSDVYSIERGSTDLPINISAITEDAMYLLRLVSEDNYVITKKILITKK